MYEISFYFEIFLWSIVAIIAIFIIRRIFNVGSPPPINLISPEKGIVKMHDFSSKELSQYKGHNPLTPIYISIKVCFLSSKSLLILIKRKVYDVSLARNFYGPGSPYFAFAGVECSRSASIKYL